MSTPNSAQYDSDVPRRSSAGGPLELPNRWRATLFSALTRSSFAATYGALLCTGAIGCADPIGPIVIVNPPLAAISFDSFESSLQDWGLVVIAAVPADTTYRPGDRERVSVKLTSSRGDSEAVRMSPYFCSTGDRIEACQQLDLVMRTGYQAQSLRPVMDQIPARFLGVSVTGSVAGLRVFDPDDVSRAVALLGTQPAVEYVGRSALLFTTLAGPFPGAGLSGGVPMDMRLVVRGNGHVEALSGDTLWIAYQQPDGTSLSATIVVP